MLGHVAGNFPAAGGVADVDCILQVEMFGNREGVGSVVIHVVTVGDLSGTAMSTAVVGNDAISFRQEEQHLRVPVVGG
jgi:hypothetical protein